MSVGYAMRRDQPDETIRQLMIRADQMMYEDKRAFYSQKTFDRRQR